MHSLRNNRKSGLNIWDFLNNLFTGAPWFKIIMVVLFLATIIGIVALITSSPILSSTGDRLGAGWIWKLLKSSPP